MKRIPRGNACCGCDDDVAMCFARAIVVLRGEGSDWMRLILLISIGLTLWVGFGMASHSQYHEMLQPLPVMVRADNAGP